MKIQVDGEKDAADLLPGTFIWNVQNEGIAAVSSSDIYET